MRLLNSLFGSAGVLTPTQRNNYFHLYMDIAWFGVLNASTLSFLNIFATRLGASTDQIALINAAPAIANLICTFPAGIWLPRLPLKKTTVASTIATRIFYLLMVVLPWVMSPNANVWALIAITLVMNIPGTVSVISGNALFAEVVVPEHRAYVVGIRNVLLAAASVVTSAIAGMTLRSLPFPMGYQLVFFVGFIGAALSAFHLTRLRLPHTQAQSAAAEDASPTQAPAQKLKQMLRFDVLRGPFNQVLFMLAFFQMALFISVPLFPQYQLNVLHMNEAVIGLGTGIFWFFHTVGSSQTSRLASWLGFRKLTAIGFILTAMNVSVFMFAHPFWMYALSQFLGGIGWSMIGGGQLNYLLERVPPGDRSPYLTWYNLAINAATLIGSILAPVILGFTGLIWAMGIAMVLRYLAGFLVLKFGS